MQSTLIWCFRPSSKKCWGNGPKNNKLLWILHFQAKRFLVAKNWINLKAMQVKGMQTIVAEINKRVIHWIIIERISIFWIRLFRLNCWICGSDQFCRCLLFLNVICVLWLGLDDFTNGSWRSTQDNLFSWSDLISIDLSLRYCLALFSYPSLDLLSHVFHKSTFGFYVFLSFAWAPNFVQSRLWDPVQVNWCVFRRLVVFRED